MAAPRKDFAIMEWEFLRFDPAFRALPNDSIRLAYLSLWGLCVHLRQDTFKPTELSEGYIPDMCGVTPQIMGELIESGVRLNLLTRGPRGSIRVRGVKSKHEKLRGWNEGKIAAPLRAIIPLTVTGTVTGTGQREKNPQPPVGEDDGSCQFIEVREAWNAMAGSAGLPKVAHLSEVRRKHLKARWGDPFWLEHWQAAIAAIPSRPFLLGQNDRGWKATLDWFLKPESVTKITEGMYQETRNAGRSPSAGGPITPDGAEERRQAFRDLEKADREWVAQFAEQDRAAAEAADSDGEEPEPVADHLP